MRGSKTECTSHHHSQTAPIDSILIELCSTYLLHIYAGCNSSVQSDQTVYTYRTILAPAFLHSYLLQCRVIHQ